MTEPTNALKRLCGILIQVNQLKHGLSDESSAATIWVRALGLEHPSALEDLICDTIAAIRSHERLLEIESAAKKELHLKYLQKAKGGLLRVTTGTWREFKATFDESTIDMLVALGEATSTFWDEEEILEDDLSNLQSDIEETVEVVLSSCLEYELKRVLLDGLESLRQAIVGYRISGVTGMREALDKSIVLLLRHREEFEIARKCTGHGVIDMWVGLINRADKIVSGALKVKQLAGPIVGQMLPGTND